jgi:hypothetical protein
MIRIPSAPARVLSEAAGTFVGALNGFIPLREKELKANPTTAETATIAAA